MESSGASHRHIPVLDMGALGIGKEEEAASPGEWQRVAQELHDALSGVGFVYLCNHGIAEVQINDLVNASSAFFKLDKETKVRYNESAQSVSHGYVEINREKLDDTQKQFEFRESYYMKDLCGVFPDGEVPELRPAAAAFVASCRTLAYRLLTALAIGLGLEKDFFVATHRGIYTQCPPNSTAMRINHYPPLPDTLPENFIRCGAHTDYGSITLLFQDSTGGLQVRGLDGAWMDAPPIPGTILINIGDLLQEWTAKKLVATEHRVVIPKKAVLQSSSRYSIAFFVHPDHDVLIRPIDGPASAAPPITARQHLLNMYAKTRSY